MTRISFLVYFMWMYVWVLYLSACMWIACVQVPTPCSRIAGGFEPPPTR